MLYLIRLLCFARCFDYERGRNRGEVLLALSCLLRTASGWRGSLVVTMAGGDVNAAFDNCSLVAVAWAMHECRVPGYVIAAFLRIQIELRLRPFFERIEVKEAPFEGMLQHRRKEGPYC